MLPLVQLSTTTARLRCPKFKNLLALLFARAFAPRRRRQQKQQRGGGGGKPSSPNDSTRTTTVLASTCSGDTTRGILNTTTVIHTTIYIYIFTIKWDIYNCAYFFSSSSPLLGCAVVTSKKKKLCYKCSSSCRALSLSLSLSLMVVITAKTSTLCTGWLPGITVGTRKNHSRHFQVSCNITFALSRAICSSSNQKTKHPHCRVCVCRPEKYP